LITACLVNGAYVLESDRAMNRVGEKALAPAWYRSFGFRLKQPLTERCFNDTTIFGAIYEYEYGGAARHHPSSAPPPRYVVAFRGTILKLANWEVTMKDLGLDADIIITNNNLEHRSRSMLARADVAGLLDEDDGTSCVDVWLAGHSLGASLALDVGRYMMNERQLNLPTFLFNLPHVSLAPLLKLLRAKAKAKRDLYYTTYFFKVSAGLLLKPVFGSHWKRMEKLYERLSPWVPNLYLNHRDLICQGYVDYFHLRRQFEERFSRIGSWSSKARTVSFRNMLFYMLGKLHGKDKERLNILSSATLWENKTQGWIGAHSLQQWWKPNVELNLSEGHRHLCSGV
jgi:hypothetical protein